MARNTRTGRARGRGVSPPGSEIDVAGVPTAGGQPSFDQTKPWGFGQQAPLTPEYQKVLEDSLADQAKGGEGNFFDHAVRCMPGGMPLDDDRISTAGIRRHAGHHLYFDRRTTSTIAASSPTAATGPRTSSRPMRATRSANGSIPPATAPTTRWRSKRAARSKARAPTTPPACRSHFDNQSIFKERIYRDKADPNILHDEITVIDHALTRPWTVDKKYVRDPQSASGLGRVLLHREQAR